MAVLGERVLDAVAHHGVVAGIVGGGEEVAGQPERAGAVVVVGVDGGEVALDGVCGAEHGVGGAPGLHAALRHGKALRQAIQGLVGVHQLGMLRDAVADGGAEVGLHLRLDDAHDAAEARAQRVVDGVIDDRMAAIIHGGDLLAAAEPAAQSGSHDDERGFVHVIRSFLS